MRKTRGVSISTKSSAGFYEFATEYAGLTFREADATHGKMHFTNVRHGIMQYRDEDDRKPSGNRPLSRCET